MKIFCFGNVFNGAKMSQSQMTIHKTFLMNRKYREIYLLKIFHACVTKYIKIDINSKVTGY